MNLPKEAYLGAVGELMPLMHKEGKTEADKDAVLLQLLAMVGNYVGKDTYMMIGDDKQQPIIWPVIVGETTAGKGTSLGAVRRVFRALDPIYSVNNFSGGIGSGEGIIEKLSPQKDDEGVEQWPDSRLWVVEEEFTSVLRKSKRDGSTLSQTLMLAWDGRPLGALTRKDTGNIPEHNVTVISHVTPDGLEAELSSTDFSNGFVNRLTFMRVGVKPPVARPVGMSASELSQAVAILRRVFTARRGEYTLTESAWTSWETNHATFRPTGGGKANEALGRLRPQVFRLALIYAILDESNVIDYRHMKAAAFIAMRSMNDVRGMFNDEDKARFQKVVMKFNEVGNSLTGREIRRAGYGGARASNSDAKDWLQSLIDDGKIIPISGTKRYSLPTL